MHEKLQESATSIRRPAYLLERMFPRFREQIGTALDLIVEFSTLGEYRLAVDGPGASGAPAEAPGQAPQLGGAGTPHALRAAVRRTVAGGATGNTPVATPAARRLLEAAAKAAGTTASEHTPAVACHGLRRHASEATPHSPARSRARKGTPKAPEQLCLAV